MTYPHKVALTLLLLPLMSPDSMSQSPPETPLVLYGVVRSQTDDGRPVASGEVEIVISSEQKGSLNPITAEVGDVGGGYSYRINVPVSLDQGPPDFINPGEMYSSQMTYFYEDIPEVFPPVGFMAQRGMLMRLPDAESENAPGIPNTPTPTPLRDRPPPTPTPTTTTGGNFSETDLLDLIGRFHMDLADGLDFLTLSKDWKR